jgi:hypothetical protein
VTFEGHDEVARVVVVSDVVVSDVEVETVVVAVECFAEACVEVYGRLRPFRPFPMSLRAMTNVTLWPPTRGMYPLQREE